MTQLPIPSSKVIAMDGKNLWAAVTTINAAMEKAVWQAKAGITEDPWLLDDLNHYRITLTIERVEPSEEDGA